MDTVKILRDLWRRRLMVAIVFVLALLAAAAVTYKLPSLQSRQYDVGVASAHILVDTPSSQVVDVAPRGSGTLGVTANLLATLMIDGPIKADIASRAGLQPSQIVGTTTAAATAAPGASPLPSVPVTRRSYLLNTQVLTNPAGDTLPIIEVDAQAPTAAGAANLTSAAINGMHDYLNSTAASEQVPNADRLRVTGLGAPQPTAAVKGPSSLVGLIVVIGVFLFGCVAILGIGALVNGWRAASARERLGGELPPESVSAADLDPTPEEASRAAAGFVVLREVPDATTQADMPSRADVSSEPESTPTTADGEADPASASPPPFRLRRRLRRGSRSFGMAATHTPEAGDQEIVLTGGGEAPHEKLEEDAGAEAAEEPREDWVATASRLDGPRPISPSWSSSQPTKSTSSS